MDKYSLNQERLKAKYKQIIGFHFISNKTKLGIEKLKDDLLQATLGQTYMDEAIPVK